MRIICILGVAGVGKSTYCKELLKERVDGPRPILLQMGKFFRETLGPEFFRDLDNPGAPEQTNHWVKRMVHNAVTLGYFIMV